MPKTVATDVVASGSELSTEPPRRSRPRLQGRCHPVREEAHPARLARTARDL